MVIRLLTGKNIAGALQYNEQKVSSGDAQWLAAGNFPDPQTAVWSWLAKREMLEFLARKNPRVEKPTVHISLAFHPTEQLTDERLRQITQEFMDGAGYGKQPYMLYRHHDTAHPHVHVVTVCVDRNGQKISDTFIKNRMNSVRQALEIRHGLVQAEAQQPQLNTTDDVRQGTGLQPGRVGGQETKAAIDATVRTILDNYSCSSFADFVRLLATYHIQARTVIRKVNGRESTGLTFRLTDGEKAISPAIKASNLTDKPTHDRLLTRFDQAQALKKEQRPVVLNTLQRELSAFQRLSESDFYATLRQAGVQVLDNGQTYLYLDHRTSTLWNETELGKSYGRAFLQGQFAKTTEPLTVRISPEEGHVLGQQVASEYRKYAVENENRHESRLIEQFPFAELVKRLRDEAVPTDRAIMTVWQFEQYKQGQLPLIQAREETEFRQLARQYVIVAGQLRLSVAGRRAFLKAVDLTLTETGVQHRDNDSLNFPLTADQQKNLLASDYQTRVSFGPRLDESERVLFQKLAVGEGRGKALFGPVNMNRLQKILPPDVWQQVCQLLNESQADRVAMSSPEMDIQHLTRLFQCGWLVQPDGSGFRLGHYQTDPATFARLTEVMVSQLRQTNYDPTAYTLFREGLLTTSGQRMVVLANVLYSENRNRLDAIKRMIYFGNQNSRSSFANDMGLLTALTDESLTIAHKKQALNAQTQQPGIVSQSNQRIDSPTSASRNRLDETTHKNPEPTLPEDYPSRGIRRN